MNNRWTVRPYQPDNKKSADRRKLEADREIAKVFCLKKKTKKKTKKKPEIFRVQNAAREKFGIFTQARKIKKNL